MTNEQIALESLKAKAHEVKVSELAVKEFMTHKVFTVQTGSKIFNVIKLFKTHRVSGAPVVEGSTLVGIVTEYDLLMQAATKDLGDSVNYNHEVTAVTPECTLMEVLVIFHRQKIRRVPVVNADTRVVGIVSRIDVLNALRHGED